MAILLKIEGRLLTSALVEGSRRNWMVEMEDMAIFLEKRERRYGYEDSESLALMRYSLMVLERNKQDLKRCRRSTG